MGGRCACVSGVPVTNVITAAAPLPLRIADFQEVLGEPTVALAKLRDLCFSGEWPGGTGGGRWGGTGRSCRGRPGAGAALKGGKGAPGVSGG